MMRENVTVVVPVYNGESSIEELCGRLDKVLSPITGAYEIILVDDASKDNSFDMMRRLHNENKAVKIIALDENYGQQNAIMCGLRHSSGDLIITMDDDLQHPPEELPKLIAKLEEGFDVVYGIPADKKHSAFRKLGSGMTDILFCLICKKPREVRVGSLRIMKREVAERISMDYTSFVYITAITLKHTRNIANIQVEHRERRYGSSNYSIYKLIKLYCKLFVYYSGLPYKAFVRASEQYNIKYLEF